MQGTEIVPTDESVLTHVPHYRLTSLTTSAVVYTDFFSFLSTIFDSPITSILLPEAFNNTALLLGTTGSCACAAMAADKIVCVLPVSGRHCTRMELC